MVQEVAGESEFRRLTGQKGKLVVVDFTASWCGPCKRVAPQYEQLASQHPDVLFLKVVEDSNKELIQSLSIRAFPTFRFYLEGNQVDETRGANIQEVASKVVQHKAKVVQAFAGEGMSLGGGSGGGAADAGAASLTPEEAAAEARARRLARFGAMESTGEGAKPDPEVAKRNAKILASAGPDDSPPVAAASSSSAMDVDPPAVPGGGALGGGSKPRRAADPALVGQLTEMGFAEVRAKKALMFGNGNDLENAVNWIMEHQEDAGIDDPIPEGDQPPAAGGPMDVDNGTSAAGGVAQSLKCDDCNVTLKDMAAAELHASKTSHDNFSESTEEVKALTPEEKEAKLARMKAIIAERRAARGEEEKVDHVKREKARRTMGKEAAKTKEEMQAIARKNEIARIRKEKQAFDQERARLKAEIAKDKAERKARGGKLSTKLGVDGYKPAAAQGVYGGPSAAGGAGAGGAAPADAAGPSEEEQPAVKAEKSEEKMEKAVDMLARQTVAGLGGTAMKTCLAYIKNALTKPEEEKFRSINLDNNAFKNRVATCIGGVALLKAVGFAKEESRLFMSMEARDEGLLANAKEKLEDAIASYVPTKAS
ncbi:PUB domain, zinc finger protein Thioredoxin [Ectocarpus siliculosus]|uniref:PUB domain, zinc finger protein Thioredoxin n=1 Tax=Ectocarpus siliculosus TaxID=2880 RepID=D7G613_ECTSI|nr:PUB domain, zinc finger protein Thioredoxin [Ectocarpus siliculosus]|eukprot:CBJ27422.1 PUB domain, zinc finger protein Thioredoxin [Ectocarpus siliculosus]